MPRPIESGTGAAAEPRATERNRAQRGKGARLRTYGGLQNTGPSSIQPAARIRASSTASCT